MKQIICHLKNLYCHHCDERDGDELFMKLEGKKIWPENEKYIKGNDGCVIAIDIKLPVEPLQKIILQLWDYDLFTNDRLGEFSFTADEEGQFKTDLRSSKSGNHKFTLEFAVYPTLKPASVQKERISSRK